MNSAALALRVRDKNRAIALKAPVSEWARSSIRADKLLQVYDTNPDKVQAMTEGGGPNNDANRDWRPHYSANPTSPQADTTPRPSPVPIVWLI